MTLNKQTLSYISDELLLLNRTADSASQLLAECEDNLNARNLGIECSFAAIEPGTNAIVCWISFGKCDGQWRLLIDSKPAAEAKRLLRIQASKHLNNFLLYVLKTLEEINSHEEK